MPDEPSVCVVCAWRADCRKRFTYEASPTLRCPDYTRDVTIPRDEDRSGAAE